MGCDIHMYVEYKDKKDVGTQYERWTPFGGHFNPGRSYDLFSLLAGVRSGDRPMYPVLGFPQDAAYAANIDNHLYVHDQETHDESVTNRKTAEKWVTSGISHWANEDHTKVTHPDWHTHSWLLLEQFEDVIKTYKRKAGYKPLEYMALRDAMRTLANKGANHVRVIFWFDN